MKEIKLTQGKVALVDDEDFEYLNQFKWYASKIDNTYYACRCQRIGKIHKKYMIHRVIMNTPANMVTDHIDHNGLNNQKNNLRICTTAQNQMNKLPQNKYKGVYFDKRKNHTYIKASIKLGGKLKHLGFFNTDKDAAIAYNIKARELFGEFANLNIL